MNLSRQARIGLCGAIILVASLSVHGYASTNSVDMEESSSMVGFGAQVVQKLKVLDVDITADASNKNQGVSIVFTIPPLVLSTSNDTTAWMQPNGGSDWVSCGAVANNTTSIACPYSGAVDQIGKGLDGSGQPLQLVTAG